MNKISEKIFASFINISKKYQDVLALDQISFDIKEGEVLGYIGPNGAGKTTTIKILVGLIQNFQGEYRFKNNMMPESIAIVSQMLGYLPQGVSFQEWRTVDQALKTFGKLSGLKMEEIEYQIVSLLELFDLSNVRYKKIVKLSGGMVQKVGLAQALLHKPKFLVLDEPLSGLDPASRYEVKTIIKDLSRKGTTIFFSSHILSDVQDIADRIAIIKDGRILKIGSADELKAELSSTYTMEIQLSSDFDNFDELKAIPGIDKIEQPSIKRMVVCINNNFDVDEVRYQILKYLINRQVRIQSFGNLESNLDEVYLNYIKGSQTQ